MKFEFSSNPTDAENYQLPILHCFKNLSSLSISSDYSLPSAYYQNEIRPVVDGSPGLTRFCLSIKDDRMTVPPMQAILGTMPRLDLTDLVLEGVTLPAGSLDPIITGNLRHLTLSPGPPFGRRCQIAWASILAALNNSRVKLPSFSVGFFEEAVDDIFDYLRSYSGLQELTIIGVHWMPEPGDEHWAAHEAENLAGRVFWNEIVPNHKDSLVGLAVHPAYNGAWCYGQLASDAIRTCTSLRRLSIHGSYYTESYDESWFSSRMTELADNGGWSLGGWKPGQDCPSYIRQNLIPVCDISDR